MVKEDISFQIDIEGQNKFRAAMGEISAELKKLDAQMDSVFGKGLISPKQFDSMKSSLKDVGSEFNRLKSTANLKHFKFDKGLEGLDKIKKDVGSLGAPLKSMAADSRMARQRVMDLRQALIGLGMTGVFVGLQVKRAFMDIARSSIDAFLKIRASLGPTNDAISALSAGMEFLKFTIGDAIATALEPFVPMLLDIIESVADWVQENPELTAQLILLGFVLGSLLFFGGQFLILLAGLIVAAKAAGLNIGAAGLAGALKGLSFGGAISGALLFLGKLLAVVAVAFVLVEGLKFVERAFKKMGFEIKIVDPLLKGLGDSLGFVIKVLSSLAVVLFASAIAIGLILAWLIRETMRGIDIYVSVMSSGAKLAWEIFALAVAKGLNIVLGHLETWIKETERYVNFFIRAINAAIEAWNFLMKERGLFDMVQNTLEEVNFNNLSLGKIPEDMTKLNAAAQEFADAWKKTESKSEFETFLKPRIEALGVEMRDSIQGIWNPLIESNERLAESNDALEDSLNEMRGDVTRGGTVTTSEDTLRDLINEITKGSSPTSFYIDTISFNLASEDTVEKRLNEMTELELRSKGNLRSG